MVGVDQALGNCIAKSIKKKEKERKDQENKKKKEKRQLIKEIKEFFKHLPAVKTFDFSYNTVFGGGGSSDDRITIEKDRKTGFIDIVSQIPIEDWDVVWVRIMHKKLPEFEAELRRRYGCDNEDLK